MTDIITIKPGNATEITDAYERYKLCETMYNKVPEFHEYVNKCCKTYEISVDFAFSVYTIQEVALYYSLKSNDTIEPMAIPNDICDCEDKSC